MSYIQISTWQDNHCDFAGFVKCVYCSWEIAYFHGQSRDEVFNSLSESADRHNLSTLHPVGF